MKTNAKITNAEKSQPEKAGEKNECNEVYEEQLINRKANKTTVHYKAFTTSNQQNSAEHEDKTPEQIVESNKAG